MITSLDAFFASFSSRDVGGLGFGRVRKSEGGMGSSPFPETEFALIIFRSSFYGVKLADFQNLAAPKHLINNATIGITALIRASP